MSILIWCGDGLPANERNRPAGHQGDSQTGKWNTDETDVANFTDQKSAWVLFVEVGSVQLMSQVRQVDFSRDRSRPFVFHRVCYVRDHHVPRRTRAGWPTLPAPAPRLEGVRDR